MELCVCVCVCACVCVGREGEADGCGGGGRQGRDGHKTRKHGLGKIQNRERIFFISDFNHNWNHNHTLTPNKHHPNHAPNQTTSQTEQAPPPQTTSSVSIVPVFPFCQCFSSLFCFSWVSLLFPFVFHLLLFLSLFLFLIFVRGIAIWILIRVGPPSPPNEPWKSTPWAGREGRG